MEGQAHRVRSAARRPERLRVHGDLDRMHARIEEHSSAGGEVSNEGHDRELATRVGRNSDVYEDLIVLTVGRAVLVDSLGGIWRSEATVHGRARRRRKEHGIDQRQDDEQRDECERPWQRKPP